MSEPGSRYTAGDGSFDDLAQGLASGTISRRRALKLAGASVASALGLTWFASPAEAAPRCPRDTRPGCEVLCTDTRKQCNCIRTVGGDKRCVHPCCSGRTCESNEDCRRSEICMSTDCCGPESERTCVTPCTEPRPDYCGECVRGKAECSAPESSGCNCVSNRCTGTVNCVCCPPGGPCPCLEVPTDPCFEASLEACFGAGAICRTRFCPRWSERP